MKFTSSRILNKKPGVMGLGIWDLTGLGYLLIFSFRALELFGLEFLAFVITILATVALIRIRLMSRPKAIRDFFAHLKRSIL